VFDPTTGSFREVQGQADLQHPANGRLEADCNKALAPSAGEVAAGGNVLAERHTATLCLERARSLPARVLGFPHATEEDCVPPIDCIAQRGVPWRWWNC
jgi:hypothetical protein